MREVNLVRFLSLLLNNLSVLSRKYGLVDYFFSQFNVPGCSYVGAVKRKIFLSHSLTITGTVRVWEERIDACSSLQ